MPVVASVCADVPLSAIAAAAVGLKSRVAPLATAMVPLMLTFVSWKCCVPTVIVQLSQTNALPPVEVTL